MKIIQHLLIGFSSTLFLYFSINYIHAIPYSLIFGIFLGSIIFAVNGNNPKTYKKNPILAIFAYINKYIFYPILRFTMRKKTISTQDIASFLSILIIGIFLYVFSLIISINFPIKSEMDIFLWGFLVSSIAFVSSMISTKKGTKPFYPISTRKLKGNVNPYSRKEQRINYLIGIPVILTISEFFLICNGHYLGILFYKYNIIFLLLIWTMFFISAEIFTLKDLKHIFLYPPSYTKKAKSPNKPYFHSPIVKYNFRYVNEIRRNKGLKPLIFDNHYSDLSRSHSGKMARTGQIFHGDNVDKTHGSYSGENCAMVWKGFVRGFNHPIHTNRDVAWALHRIWMKSSGHRRNILDPSFNYIGIGIYTKGKKIFATQLFSN